jgi:uncharacterized protein YjbI with pentapeptide repeats
MQIITQEELEIVLADHALWLQNETQGKRADLSDIDFCDVSLKGLCFAKVRLQRSRFVDTNLYFTRFENADLRYSDFTDTDLQKTFFEGSDLRWAHLENACCIGTRFTNTNLSFAYTTGTTNFRLAQLEGAKLNFTTLPLSCNGLDWIVDEQFAAQLAYHFCRMKCSSKKVIQAQNALLELANKFHRIDFDCVRLNPIPIP